MKDNGREVAIKISKQSKTETDSALTESKILYRILSKEGPNFNLLKIYDAFTFRRHFLIVTEIMDINLFAYSKLNNFQPIAKDLLHCIATQILTGLNHLANIGLIHCDLKPENILFTDPSHRTVKIIDFGSACTDFKNGFTYVQSRYYRAPEVVLGLPYTNAVDMWSFACILLEMVTGIPFFPARDEKELLEFFYIRIGMPSTKMIQRARNRS